MEELQAGTHLFIFGLSYTPLITTKDNHGQTLSKET